ncbi:Cu(I)/Ag(I) efflux system membrane fusion protein [Lewinella aquimaris]|uniref:Cu(I)/Ag(I) efflux system membrane fusion protein n=1 Tax=Neolewinella aquimaris TaxID=1835722 RepID=A0A840E6P6_9BACT|nr:efflux RND transporter periplasmic adaptor subunit [Neolewinella aquimaris]MBB4079402.1 Cu(I)/Ag(I) efflux system membrane fusion protein [Neolewinella aquimaris]
MKLQPVLYLLFAVVVGLFGGYLLFGNSDKTPIDDTEHDHSLESDDETTWTCSMHPQIQRDEPGDCPICGMDLIPMGSASSSDPTVLTMTEAAVALARVRTTVVGTGSGIPDPKADIRLTGTLASDERTAAVQSINYGGRLERLLVTFPGEQVRAGQRIATIYSPELVIAQEELLEARKLEALSPELTVAARNKLRNFKISEEQISEVETTGEVISNFPVYAERGGTVLDIRARVGDYVQAGAALYTLTNLDRLWALFDAYERDLNSIRVGDRVSFSVASLPDETFTARVTFIDPLINPATRTATIRAEVNNSRGRLKPEMFITGAIGSTRPVKTTTDAPLTVPKTAVLWTGNRSVVYVATPDADIPTYQFREVTLGESTGGSYRVLSGLEAGEVVVTNGAFSIDAAAQLNNQLSMMNRDVVIQGREAGEVTAMALPDYTDEATQAFRSQLSEVARAYLPLKDRLVASELATDASLTPLRTALSEVDMTQVKDDAHLYWMELLNAMNTHLGGVAGAEELGEQRKQFGFLSQTLINALTAFGADDTLYVQHCPMAFGGAGGNWLSEESSIRNPFYGDAMLTCGSTIDTLSK